MGGEDDAYCNFIAIIGFRFTASYADIGRGFAPLGMRLFERLIIVLKGRSVKALGGMK